MLYLETFLVVFIVNAWLISYKVQRNVLILSKKRKLKQEFREVEMLEVKIAVLMETLEPVTFDWELGTSPIEADVGWMEKARGYTQRN